MGSYATTDTRVSVFSSEFGSQASSSSTSATSLSVSPESICHSSCRPESLSQATLVTVSSPVTSSIGLSGSPQLSRPPAPVNLSKSPVWRSGDIEAPSRRESETENDAESYYSALSQRPRSGIREDFWYAGLPHVPSISPIRIDELGLLGVRSREEASRPGADGAILGLDGAASFHSLEDIDYESARAGMSARREAGRKLVSETEVRARLGDVLRREEWEVLGSDGGSCYAVEKSGWSD